MSEGKPFRRKRGAQPVSRATTGPRFGMIGPHCKLYSTRRAPSMVAFPSWTPSGFHYCRVREW